MLLIGVFALVLIIASPARADPISVAILGTVSASLAANAFAVAVTTFVLTAAISIGLSFVAQMLFRPPKPSQSPGQSEGGSAQRTGNMITVREAVAVKNIVYGRRRVAGKIVFAEVTDENRFLHMAIVFAGHEIDAFEELYLNEKQVLVDDANEMVVTGEFTGLARLKRHLGSPNQGADGTLIAETRGAWGESDRLRGCAWIYARFEFEPSVSNPTFGGKVYQGGVPNLTATIRGKKVFDPISVSTYWTANSALCLADYLTDATYGIGITYAEIDGLAIVAAVNACEESVPLAQGGDEARYWTDGELLSSAEPQENIGLLLGAMQGRLHYDGDKWRIIAGVYVPPTVDLTDDDLRAGPTINCILSRRDLFNSVKGTFVDRANNYIRSDFPPVVSPEYVAHDGEQLWCDIDLPMTTSYSRAQRIAKIQLQAVRQPITAVMPCKLSAWRVQAGDTVTWTSARYGWDHKPFEIRKATFAVGDDGTLGVDLELAETTSAIYDWLSGDQDLADPAPDTNFPDIHNVLPPANLTVGESLYSTRNGGGAKAKATLDWTASPDHFVVEYQPEFKETAGAIWTKLPRTTNASVDILDMPPGTYDFRVAALNWAGVLSGYVTLVAQQITGLAAPPAPPQNFTVSAHDVLALARWDLPQDLDVLEGGFIAIRHSSLTVGATWDAALSIAEFWPANGMAAWLALKTGTYLAKFVDASGHYSTTPASYVQTQASVHTYTPIAGGASVQDPGFTGVKTDCFVDGGVLKLGGAGDFDSVADVDALTSVDFLGGVSSYGTYEYDAIMDLGSVRKHRLTNTVVSRIDNVLDKVDDRAGDVDLWPDFDGAVTGDEADSRLLVASTNDDPAGAPAWGDWQRLDAATFEARAHKFKRELFSRDVAFTVEISEDAVIAEEV